ncbi:carboxypeptidase [Oceanobacillus piezotolerans]|uniref:Carboxypeptidase n=1 Tax=Oceanobacillus piezotolerans TaxID=2448030 RepID=A0A498D7M4_9BACI|nr:D-alanyl-D-alanine carboxypeptidase family protein [Oceanobacillus piezotolerans]RLL42054.1 carboxypeptidase [Oceanobacillus piezotolerans]
MIKKIIGIGLLSSSLVLSACAMMDNSNPGEEKEPNNDTAAQEREDNKEADSVNTPEVSLQKKDEGKEVEQLQTALNTIGYELTINGQYDEMTTWAITDLQLQQGLTAIGIYNEETMKTINELLENSSVIEAGIGLPIQAEPVSTSSGTPVIGNPYDQLALVNKEYALPQEYEPGDLVTPDVPFPFEEDLPKKQIREVAATKLEELFQAAEEAGLDLYAQSGYRSYDRQEELFANYVSNHGEEEANLFSARPGESEHQSGLTMDVTSPDVEFQLNTDFGETDEGKWLAENAAEFGFIIRYPEGKEEITKYQYEPWHIRYVGEKAAKEITENNLTLEEYLTN